MLPSGHDLPSRPLVPVNVRATAPPLETPLLSSQNATRMRGHLSVSVTLTESPMCSIRGSTTAAVEFRAGFISRRVETASRTHIGNIHSTRTRSAACRNRCPASARGRRWPADAIAPGHEEDAANPALQQGADPDYLPQLSETGGIEGLLIFNKGQNTFQNTHTDFMRILLQACNIPKVWNYLYTRKQAAVELLTMKVEVASPDEPNAQDCPLKVVTRSCRPPVWTVWRGTTYGEGVRPRLSPSLGSACKVKG